MKKDTLEILSKIYDQTSKIFNLYNLLIKMEILNRESTKEYQNLVFLLNVALEEEKELYKYFDGNPNEFIIVFMYIMKIEINGELFFSDDYEITVNNDPFQMIQARINRNIHAIRYKDPLSFMHFLEIEDIKCVRDESEKEGFRYLYEMIPNIHLSAKKRMISYIDDIIKTHNKKKIREYFINDKYHLSFLDPDLEKDYIKHNFRNTSDNKEIEVSTKVKPITKKRLLDRYGNIYLSDALKQAFGINHPFEFYDINPATVGDMHLENPENEHNFLFSIGLLELPLFFFSEEELKIRKNELYNSIPKYKFQRDPYVENCEIEDLTDEEKEKTEDDFFAYFSALTKSEQKIIILDLQHEYAADYVMPTSNSNENDIQNANYFSTTLDMAFNQFDEIKKKKLDLNCKEKEM